VAGLAPTFRFNVVAYDCAMRRMWPQLRRADDAAKQAAVAWVNGLRAAGGTGTGPATALALSDREVQALALLTDGEPNCGCDGREQADFMKCHREMIQRANVQRAVINVFKIGSHSEWTGGNLREFCRNVAADSGGSFTEIPDGSKN
jgi:hypothetical protein